ncbi:FemAB family XrtA/PEP-CTERM system-associated protein [Chitinivorax sp. B]|uniref:FemAB family XrtA/PEP-CTERM system-associated protein n=1 Tax=Chitinivorax sp. B TaxID=2502235 RepID=UPI002017C1C0|nr:FemAB family XrtA/PEP-CTERM system-associated protein [Chitinivorax sp. B]
MLRTNAMSEQLTVREMSADDVARWDTFVEQCPEATFFHRAGWKRVIEGAFGHRCHFLLAERAGQIEGVLPLCQVKSLLFGNSLVSLPFCVYGGAVARFDDVRAKLDEAAIQLAHHKGVDHLEYRSERACHPDWAHKDLYVTFRKEIDPDVDANMLAIPRKQRAMVRKAIKFELQGQLDDDVERFFTAYSTSVHRLGTPVFSKRYFKLLREVFGRDCEVLTIVQGDTLVASVLSFYFRDQVLPYYGGGMDVARDVAGNDFMYWDLMRRACERGLKVFDFGRSKIGTGAFDFKKNWGFEPTPLQYEYHLIKATSVPDHNPLNPKYQMFIKAWQRMPIQLANMIGPHIVKNLG